MLRLSLARLHGSRRFHSIHFISKSAPRLSLIVAHLNYDRWRDMHSLYLFRDLKPQRNRHASSVCLEIAQEGQMRRHMLEKRDQLAHNNSFFFCVCA